jgi:hypothetical protein
MIYALKKSAIRRLQTLVPGTGLEPACLAALPPEDSASTNFAIRARECKSKIFLTFHKEIKNKN